MFLTPQELIELTGKRRHSSQAAELRRLGIEHKARGDGSLVVHAKHVDNEFGAGEVAPAANTKRPEPNWAAI